MKKLLKIALVSTVLMLMLSMLASCDALFGKKDEDTPQYTINFNFGEGQLPEGFENSIKVDEGGKVTLPEPSKEGHDFLGWYVGDKLFTEADTVTENMQLTPKWEPKDMNVTVVGSPDEKETVKTVDWGTSVTLDTPVREGYNFAGWFVGDNAFNPETKITENITVYAKWESKKFDVTFVNPFAENPTVKNADYGETVTPDTPSQEGYNFIGWFVGEVPFTSETIVTTNTTVTAKWEIQKVTVIFLNYFNQQIDVQEIDWGTAATAPDIAQTANGKPFLAWSFDITCVKNNITVKPIYDNPSYIVTFETGLASKVDSQKVYNDAIPTKPADPEMYGNSLVGWYLEPTYETLYTFDRAFNEDVTLYAKFEIDYVTISTAEQLDLIRENPQGKYVLLNDIDYKANVWTPIENFSGIIDGDGFTIYNFSIANTGTHFGFINTNNGTIKNLKLDKFTVDYSHNCANGEAFAGMFAAVNNGTIKNCELIAAKNGIIEYEGYIVSTHKTSALYFGSIVGANNGTITGCVNNANLSINFYCNNYADYYTYDTTTRLNAYIGGIAGVNNSVIEKTESYGVMSNTAATNLGNSNRDKAASMQIFAGGIAGRNNGSASMISECFTNIEINIKETGSGSTKNNDFGTLCGRNDGTVINCSASGIVNISNEGQILTGNIGGAVGYNPDTCKIENIFTDVDILVSNTISAYVGGILGQNCSGASLNKSVFVGNITVGTDVSSYGLVVGLRNGTVHDCYYDSASVLTVGETVTAPGETEQGTAEELATIQSENFIYSILYWDEEIWQINEVAAPSLKSLAD